VRPALYNIGSALPMNSAVETEPASRPTLFIEPPGLDLHRASRFSLLPARSRYCATRKKESKRWYGDTPTRATVPKRSAISEVGHWLLT
jgi:hypothetical protein